MFRRLEVMDHRIAKKNGNPHAAWACARLPLLCTTLCRLRRGFVDALGDVLEGGFDLVDEDQA